MAPPTARLSDARRRAAQASQPVPQRPWLGSTYQPPPVKFSTLSERVHLTRGTATHKTAIIHLPRSQSLVATTALTRVPTTANSSQCSCGHPQYTCRAASHWWPQLELRDLSQDPPLSKDPPLPPNVCRCASPLARQGCTTQRAQIFQTSASQQRRRAARRRRRTPATRIMTDLRAATDSPIVILFACAVGPPRILATPTIPHP